MAKSRFNQQNKEVLDSFLLEIPEVEPGKAFGYPAYYVNGKMFACVYEDGVSIKLPKEMVPELLEQDGISQFRPMDKHVMKQWVLVTRDEPDQYLEDKELLTAALEYVFELSKKK